jgi:hypothetical protein
MSQNQFPDGWDEGKVQRVLAHYGTQSEDEALAEDEAGIAANLQAGTFSTRVRSNWK